ncbi:ribonuclease P protein component [Patescibacteria group bacterium]|nr:ribonuclease P protein component [Patescibacteria group bacterium]
MLPKENRFSARVKGDFFANAKKKYSPLLVLYHQENNLDVCRATVIVPKKVIAKSTMRSEIKRQLRNALVPYLSGMKGYDLVLYLKSWKSGANYNQLQKEVTSFF